MRLRKVSPIETVKAVGTENASLFVQVIRFTTMNEEALLLSIHQLWPNHVEKLLNAIEIVTACSLMKVEVINLQSAVITLFDMIPESFAKSSLLRLILLTEQV